MGVYVIYTTFIIFIVLLILSGLYFIRLLNYEKSQNDRIRNKVDTLKDTVEKHLQYTDLKEISVEEIEKLKKIVSNKIGLQAFLFIYRYTLERDKSPIKHKEYASMIISYKTLMNNRIVRNKYRQSYILYLISEFEIDTKEVRDFALESLNERSVYIRNNALRLIERIADADFFIESLNIIDTNQLYFNEKILIDFLDSFKRNEKVLTQYLLDNIDRYSQRTKKLIIEHFSNNKIENMEIRDKLLEYLRDGEDKEVIIAATKYFGKISDYRSIQYILKNFNSSDWEIRAVSTKIAGYYKNEETKSKLIESLKDPNYLVRYNSGFSYVSMEEDDDLDEAIEDKYGKQMLDYVKQSKEIDESNNKKKALVV